MTQDQEQAIRVMAERFMDGRWADEHDFDADAAEEMGVRIHALLAALDAARVQGQALLARLEALEQRYRAEAHVDDGPATGDHRLSAFTDDQRWIHRR